jgi:transcriptional regulator with XRE-family HTH domain
MVTSPNPVGRRAELRRGTTPSSPIGRFGENLKRIRIARGLSQEGLMDLADVHRTQISEYERGKVQPQIEILVRLAVALEVNPGRLLADDRSALDPPDGAQREEVISRG